jgi:hypothetical protein
MKWERVLSLASARGSFNVEPTSDLAGYRDIVARIDKAIAPSLAMYEEAREHATTPELRMLAAYGIGLTHLDAMIRARNAALAPDAMSAEEGSTMYRSTVMRDAYDERHATIEPMLVDHRAAALGAFHDVRELADEQPGVAAANPVMTFIVADARRQMEALQPTGERVPSVSSR